MSNFVRSYQFISPNDDQENDKIIYIYIYLSTLKTNMAKENVRLDFRPKI